MLRVLAISAPSFISKGQSGLSHSFKSKTPFSLQNALRDAVDNSIKINGAWSGSNFKNKDTRGKAVYLMEYWVEEREYFEQLLEEIRPNLLLIGSMTLSFPGAIEIATYAKKRFQDDICIVLGGKHVNESFYYSNGKFKNLVSSPLSLMEGKKIPRVFDLVISGDGEAIVTRLGEIVAKLEERNCPVAEVYRYKDFLEEAKGDWIAGQIDPDGLMRLYKSKGHKIDYTSLAFPTDQFPLTAGFEIFNTDYTAHAFSDISKGCPYQCFFCSEKGLINGKMRIKDHDPAQRLFNQFNIVNELNKSEYHGKSISIFIEDSILLGAFTHMIEKFNKLLDKNNINIPFGCQFTLDTFLDNDNQKQIKELVTHGLRYVAFGVETSNEEIASTFSKNTKKEEDWITKTEEVVLTCRNLNIDCGMFLLWGLGESQKERVEQLRKIIYWKYYYEINIDVGLNIATLHPLRDPTNTNHYIEWGTGADSPYLNYFIEVFGEASEKYKVTNKNYPTPKDLKELKDLFFQIKQPFAKYV